MSITLPLITLPKVECKECVYEEGHEECPWLKYAIDENTVVIGNVQFKVICFSGLS